VANDNSKRNSNKTKDESAKRRFWSRRLAAPLSLIFLIIWIPVFAIVQMQNIQAPVKYVRQDNELGLIDQYGTNFGRIVMNCFDTPFLLSAFMLYRQAEVNEEALLRKDMFVCDFNYRLLNRTATIANATIEFIYVDSNFDYEKLLHVNETEEQILFPMPFSGWYTFEIWLEPTIHVGWEQFVFKDLNFYVYESPQSYAQAKSAYAEAIASILGSVIGSIIGAVGIVLTMMDRHETPEATGKLPLKGSVK
jgi:hypothetical protein